MRRALTIARKELRDVMRERSIILALIVQAFVAAFSAFLAFGLVGIYDPEQVTDFPTSEVAYIGPGGFDDYLRRAPEIRVVPSTLEEATRSFAEGRFAALVEETYGDPDGERLVTLFLPEGEFRTTLVVSQVKVLLEEYERDLRIDRAERVTQQLLYLETDAEPGAFFGFAYGVLIPLLVLTPVFLGGAIAGDAMAQERTTQTLSILRSTPTGTLELVLGKLLTPILLVPAQVALWFLFLAANDLVVFDVAPILVFALALALFVASASSLMALTIEKENQTQASYALLVLGFFALAYLLPRDPLNLIARFAVGRPDAATYVTLGIYAILGILVFITCTYLAKRKLETRGQ